MNKYDVILLIIYLYGLYNLIKNKSFEFFDNKLLTEEDIYDKQYIEFYKVIFNMNDVISKEINLIEEKTLSKIKNKENINILDAGCGTGLHSSLLQKKGYDVIGIDKSKNMLKSAEYDNVYVKYILGDFLNLDNFKIKSFSHIISNSDSFYLNNENQMKKIIINYFRWLKDGGFLIFYLVDNKKLDPSPKEYSQYFIDNKKNKHSYTHFKGFTHDAWFMTNNERSNGYDYYQKITINKDEQRIKILKYTFPDRKFILDLILSNGFKYYSSIDLSLLDVGDYEIIIFRKNDIHKNKII